MDSEVVLSQLQAQIFDLHKREVASCEQINQLTRENLELIKQAAKAKAYKKQIDILLSDPLLVKIRTTSNDEQGIEIESDSQMEEKYQNLLQKLKDISSERDRYALIAEQNAFIEGQIEQKNKEIVVLTGKLKTAQDCIESYKAQLDSQSQTVYASLTDDEGSRQRITSLEKENQKLKELLEHKASEIGTLSAINTDFELRNKDLTKQLSDAKTMISLQQTENRMISDPLFDKGELAKRIKQTFERSFKNADELLDAISKRVVVLENKIGSFKENGGKGEDSENQQELIEELQDQIRYLEEHDASPKLAAALKKISDLEKENEWLKIRK